MSLLDHSALELLALLQSNQVRAEQVVTESLSRIEQLDPPIGSFLHVNHDGALAAARDVDRRRHLGQPVGALAGLPVALKDLICTIDQPTTCASRMLANFRPPYDATVVARLRAADAILIGKTNLDEFAMGSSTESSALQRTRNPWNRDHVPGGSSGGSAACIASDLVPLALGTDTGGSIRQPAAFCGITGLKPTYGRVSRYGLIAFASSLDQIGPMCRSAADAALLLQATAGHDRHDSTSADVEVPDYLKAIAQPISGLRIGILRQQLDSDVDPEIHRAVTEATYVLKSLGALCQDIDLPHSQYGVATYYVIAPCEASSNLARYDGVHYGFRATQLTAAELTASESADLESEGPLVRMYRRTRETGFGAEVKRRIMLGTYALSAGYYDAYYLKAQRVRRLIRQDFDRAYQQVDALLGPVTPTPAFRFGEKSQDPLSMYLGDLFTVSANLAGLPGLSIPCGITVQGLPIGLHLQGPSFAEPTLLRLAHAFQQATDWHARRPPTS
ncbi:MAG: Asp-tRNA(Asn)/Glu-tRNA(Gln) amidotransferase subunit GatA [Planctomycetota bacterium]|nr:Asp-tRNA(Asn)/Glu-tRNA(Gln) amidotransferase subunit GatA [Planctomycetota bacterium]MDA1178282.1 Asp-tRNA(Asn)/Glu-tRNA(Gln) amidotransferase subunit GatA [Planctomycetota bacterium]